MDIGFVADTISLRYIWCFYADNWVTQKLIKNISEIEPNVDLIELNGKTIFLVGTAHISHNSVELVERVIREKKPDTVCVELCDPRYQSLQDPERWKNTDVFQVIRSGRAYVLMAQLGLAGYQKKLGDELKIRPGEEMRKAIAVADELGCELYLADREVRTTLKRAWGNASLWSLTKLFFSMIGGLFSSESLSEADIEKLKETDALTALTEQFGEALPGIKVALLDERDLYLASKIANSPGNTVVAVVGAAHAPGIRKCIGEDMDLAELDKVPPPRKLLTFLSWAIPSAIVGMIIYGFFNFGAERSGEMIMAWFLINGILAAIGTLIALAHPLTILSAFVAAPFTSLNPMIAAGWVSGLVEAFVRKPRVVDLETIGEDVTSVRGIWSNRVSKVLLVVILANLGSSFGTLIGAGSIIALLKS